MAPGLVCQIVPIVRSLSPGHTLVGGGGVEVLGVGQSLLSLQGPGTGPRLTPRSVPVSFERVSGDPAGGMERVVVLGLGRVERELNLM